MRLCKTIKTTDTLTINFKATVYDSNTICFYQSTQDLSANQETEAGTHCS